MLYYEKGGAEMSIRTCMLTACAVLLCFMIGCGDDTDSGGGEGKDNTPACPFTEAQMDAAALYSEECGGSAVLIMYKGGIIFEEYQNGADENTAQHIHSATKGFWAGALAAAIEDGLISDMDETVAGTITEWLDGDLHFGKIEITVGHLASLSSGLSQDVEYIQGLDPLAPDIYQYVVDELDMVRRAGVWFQYGPSHYYAFGEFLSRKLDAAGMDPDPLAYLEERILDRIGVEYSYWERDDAGNPHIPNGCFITPRNWIKYGRFILQNGQWEGVSIVDEECMKALRNIDGPNPGHARFLWANTNGGYGHTPDQITPEGAEGGFIYHDGHTGMVAALGAGKNRMYIIPQLDTVVLRQTSIERDTFIDHDFLAKLLTP